MQYENIILEEEQIDLLLILVEAARNVQRDERDKFRVIVTSVDDILFHPGLGKKIKIYMGDLEILNREGLISLQKTFKGMPNFDVTPKGFKYYEYIKTKNADSTKHIEDSIIKYIKSDIFLEEYNIAFQKWLEAERLLWSSDSKENLTTIGHLCRECIQEFTDILIKKYNPPNFEKDKSKTKNRLKSVLNHKISSSTKINFLEALVGYWSAISDLIQKQEHGSQRDNEPLVWEDGRRVVFQTLILMFEIDRTLNTTT